MAKKRHVFPETRYRYGADLSEGEIRGVSGSYYKGKGNIEQVMLFTENNPKDFGKDLPIWQVIYDDSARTRLYISPITGELINVRTRLWRAFDFMWMLHIMDYQERDNINLWWLKLLVILCIAV